MRLLLDENISPTLVHELWKVDVDAIHPRDRGCLGMADYAIWRYATVESRTIVTINVRDFIKLAEQERHHFGVVAIPSGGTRAEQLAYIATALGWAKSRNMIRPGFPNLLVEVQEDLTVAAAEVHLSTSSEAATVVRHPRGQAS